MYIEIGIAPLQRCLNSASFGEPHYHWHRRQSLGSRSPIFWDGGSWGLHEILAYPTMDRDLRREHF